MLDILKLLKNFVTTVTGAKNDADLNESARLFAQVMVMGTAMVVQLLTRKRGRGGSHHEVVRMHSKAGQWSWAHAQVRGRRS